MVIATTDQIYVNQENTSKSGTEQIHINNQLQHKQVNKQSDI